MARSVNKVTLIGNLTRDPEMRYTPDGQPVTTFGVATNRRWTTKEGNQKEDAEFHNIVAWGKLAEICSQILKKGRRVYVEGRLKTQSWEGKDGVNRTRTEIVISDMVALDPRSEGDYEPDSGEEPEIVVEKEVQKKKPAKKAVKASSKEKENAEEISEDEIPF
jgi:single-strand DNA-binding protein